MMRSGQPSSARKWHRKSQLLIALEAARRIGWEQLGRYQVQKVVYLGEVLAPLRGILAQITEFHYDKNGPYSGDIRDVLDHLVAIRLIDMFNYRVVTGRNREIARYAISDDGTALVERLVANHQRHQVELAWFQSILTVVDIHGLDRILDLVYQEPTFKTLRLREAKGAPIELEGESNQTLALFALAESAIRTAYQRQPDAEELLCLYFQYLDTLCDQESFEGEQVVN